MHFGGPGRNRTTDTRIFSPLLYRLSYQATKSTNYTQTVVQLDKCADCARSIKMLTNPCVGGSRPSCGRCSKWNIKWRYQNPLLYCNELVNGRQTPLTCSNLLSSSFGFDCLLCPFGLRLQGFDALLLGCCWFFCCYFSNDHGYNWVGIPITLLDPN